MKHHLRGSGFCVVTTHDSWLLGLDQGICGGCWHIQYRFLTRNLSCFIKTNSLDSFSLCSNVFRVCHSDGLGMIGFFLSHVFHPLEKNIVWKLLSCLAVEVIQQSHSFCLWHSMRLGVHPPGQGELSQEKALFSCCTKATLTSTSPICCLSPLATPPGPGRAWMKGWSRLEWGRLPSGCVIRNLSQVGSSWPPEVFLL